MEKIVRFISGCSSDRVCKNGETLDSYNKETHNQFNKTGAYCKEKDCKFLRWVSKDNKFLS